MSVSLLGQGRMPYITFEERSEEDRAATLATGRYSSKSVDYVIIRQIGAKDSVEKNAVEWLQTLQNNANWDPSWVEKAKSDYAAYKAGHEPTPDGTHIRQWPAVDRATCDMLISVGVRTVEDLAAANAETLQRIGMGAATLRQKAKAWLDSSDSFGKAGEELTALRAQTEAQSAQIAELQAMVRTLAAKAATAPEPAQPLDFE